MIKKIVFKNLSTNGASYTAIGGIRFYDKDDVLISSGDIITNEELYGETDNMIINATISYGGNVYYNPVNPFNTNVKQNGTYNDHCYWLTAATPPHILDVTFKIDVTSMSKIEFVAQPGSDRNVGIFDIDIFDEKDKLLQTYNVTPNGSNNIVEILLTPELENLSIIRYLLQNNETNNLLSFKKKEYAENLIPIMSSNTSPSGIANANSEFSIDYQAWKAFNGIVQSSDYWFGGSTGKYIDYQFDKPKIIDKFTIVPYLNDRNHDMATFNFIAYNESTQQWDILGEFKNTIWTNDKQTFYVDNIKYYKKYGFEIITCTSISGVAITEIEMMESIPYKLVNLGNIIPTENDYKSNDFDDITLINGKFNQTKIFGTTGTINSGKVFEITIPTNVENIEEILNN